MIDESDYGVMLLSDSFYFSWLVQGAKTPNKKLPKRRKIVDKRQKYYIRTYLEVLQVDFEVTLK